ncbi:MAG: hypothetical protein ACRDL5_18570 [Solirubrobacteraceae bacterium]
MKILVLTGEPITASDLRSALPAGVDPHECEVRVVAPALHRTALQFWVSDADEAITKADAVRRQSERQLDDEDVPVASETGDSDPLEAIADALREFDAERIVVIVGRESQQRYRGDPDPSEIAERFRIPVDRATVARSEAKA